MRTYTLIDADGLPVRSAQPGTLGGHRGSRIYGRLDCPGAARAIARGGYVTQRVFFADEATAIAAGYRPCATCLPDRHRAWKAARSRPARYTTVASPIGELIVVATPDAAALTAVAFPGGEPPTGARRDDEGLLGEAARQLRGYGAGLRTSFELPLRPAGGGTFERRVWAAVRAVPYGTTTTYGALAEQLGAPRGARAVGSANGRNPLPLIVPCHRVVGAGGALTGYAGGLEAKRLLLEHEGALMATA